jgi:hypothetical protein
LLNTTTLFVAPCLFNVAIFYLFKVIASYLFDAIVPLIAPCFLNVVVPLATLKMKIQDNKFIIIGM